jgi:putative membrane protein
MVRFMIFGATVACFCGIAQAQTPIPPAPQDFVMTALQSDQYEIMAAQVALVEAQDARVRAFAEAMIRDHMRLSESLRETAKASGLEAPGSGMSSDQAALLSGLQGLRGADFDKAYVRQQAIAHAQAVAVEESFAEGGANPRLQHAAQDALPTIKAHLNDARQLQAALGGS